MAVVKQGERDRGSYCTMIGKLRGIVDEKDLDLNAVIIDVRGVGFEVSVPRSTLVKIPAVGESVVLFIYTYVREDTLTLYGFATKEEKELFQTLLGVSGVGPKLALAILSDLAIDTFKRAIVEQDVKTLSKISGVGKKTAERLILELKGKFNVQSIVGEDSSSELYVSGDVYSEALAALQTLGYTLDEAESSLAWAVKSLSSQGQSNPTTEVLVSQALKGMAVKG